MKLTAHKITVYRLMVAIDYSRTDWFGITKPYSTCVLNHYLGDVLPHLDDFDMSAVKVDYRQDNPVFDTYIATKYLGIV